MAAPKTKVRTLIFGLVLPYFAVVMYFVLRRQEHPLPSWFPYFALPYLLGTMILVALYGRRISRAAQHDLVNKPQPVRRRVLRAWAGYLIAVWSCAFLWDAYQTISGNLDWHRALPAGAFLLAFIALFSRLLYSDIKRPAQPTAYADPKATNKS
jgi:hypothetical protein